MKNLFYKILSLFQEDRTFGAARSPLWGQTKKRYEKIFPKRCFCGNTKVQLHHKQSFATHPELENDLTNLCWLCEGLFTKNHHLEFGHLGSFHSLNLHLDEWIKIYQTRPKWNGKEWINS